MQKVQWLLVVVCGFAGVARADDPAKPAGAPAVRLFGEQDDGDPPAAVKKIKAELKLAGAGKARLLVLGAATTDNWGCACAPFVYKPFEASAEDESTAFFYPIVAAGPDPGAFQVGSGAGSYEFTGRFTKEKLNHEGWLTRRKVKHRATRATGSLKAKQPVFAVDSWCFRKADEVSEPYAEIVAQMTKASVTFCK